MPVANNTDSMQSTKRYSKFKFLGTNRVINQAHVRALMREFEDFGNITQTSPVLVTPRMEVIDGQHRLEACKELGLPVYYKVMPNLSIRDARRMNIAQRSWRSNDYLLSYVNEGRRPYIKLAKLMADYEDYNFGHSVIQMYALGGMTKGYNAMFRNGEFPDFDLGEARKRLDNLAELADIAPDFTLKSLATALLDVMESPHYDQERMVRKVNQRRGEVRAYSAVTDNRRMLENVFNDGASVNRVRLF